MQSFLMDVRVAWLNLLEHRRRGLLLGSAIGIVTFLLIALGALSAGIRGTLTETATTLSSGHLNVGGFFKVNGGQAAPAITRGADVEKVVARAVPEADFIVQRGRGWAKVVSDTASMHVGLAGLDIAAERDLRRVLSIAAGRLEDLRQPGSVLVFEKQAKKLGVGLGDTLTIVGQTTREVNNTIDAKVVAIARDVGVLSEWSLYVPAASVRDLYRYQANTTGAIQVYLRPEAVAGVELIAERVRRELSSAGHRVMDRDPRSFWLKLDSVSREDWTGQKLDVTSWEDELSFLTWPLQAIDGLTWVLALTLLAIVVAGIMNTMWIAVRERTREIGTLRAIGMPRLSVVRMFLLESLLLGAAGSTAGALLGVLFSQVVNAASIQVPLAVQLFLMTEQVHLEAQVGSVVGTVLLLTIVTGLAALYPAMRAARLRPIAAMSHFS